MQSNGKAILLMCLLLATLPAWQSLALAQDTPPSPPIDWIFVIDTSRSMRGEGSANIFSDVQRAVKNFIQSVNQGDTITIYRFDSSIKEITRGVRFIVSQADRDSLSLEVDGLVADGWNTHTGEAIQQALNRQYELRTSTKNQMSSNERKIFIILLTDGVEDTSDKPSARHLEDIQIPPKELRPYTIIVWLGKEKKEFDESPLRKFKDKFGEQGEVLYHPEARDIQSLVTEVRGILPPALAIITPILKFGQVEPGSDTSTQMLKIRSDRATSVYLELARGTDSGISLVAPSHPVELQEGDNNIEVALKTVKAIPDGPRKVALQVLVSEVKLNPKPHTEDTPPMIGTVPIEFTVIRIPVWVRSLKWAGLLLGLLTLAVVVLCIRYDTSPPGLYRMWQRRMYLVGGLEVKTASPQKMDAVIDLEHLRTSAVRVSELPNIPPHLGGDAELAFFKENGDKGVQLRDPQGMVRLNGRPVVPQTTASLYNGDVIQIGEALILTYLGRERPETSEIE